MKKLTLLTGVIFTMVNAASAGFHFGLGKAAAKTSAQVISCAQDPNDNSCKKSSKNNSGGNNWASASSLAGCGSGSLFSTMPVALNEFQGLVPLGNLNPTGHTFPTKHLYFCNAFNQTGTIYFPGNVRVTGIASSENLTQGTVDYSIYFSPCKEVASYLFHISTLSAVLLEQAGAFTNCSTYTTGGQNYRRCDKSVSIDVNAGDLVGYVKYQYCFDLGARDSRITPLAFANPSRYTTSADGLDDLHVVCAVDYFSEPTQSNLKSRLGLYDGSALRTTSPICGTSMQDVAGAAQGNWFFPNSSGQGEDAHLALVHHNVFPSTAVFSVGSSMSSLSAGTYYFYPTSSGLINHDFNGVTSDGNIYCYDTLRNTAGELLANNAIILIQLTNSATLKIEKQSAASCGAGPWSFTSSATIFER